MSTVSRFAAAVAMTVFVAAGFVTTITVAQSSDELSTPEWMTIDNEAETVTLEVVAGKTDANNSWNFNGLSNGEATVVVPVGYTITIAFQNNDAVMAHSLGIGALQEAFPPIFDEATPVFEGAITSNATDMTAATPSGESEEITFVASEAGEYAMICYIPAHAITGMWIGFTVSESGEAGLISG